MNTRKLIFLLISSLTLMGSCQNQLKETSKETPIAQETPNTSKVEIPTTEPTPIEMEPIEIPEGYSLIGETEGDLDKDGKDEKIQVYDTGAEAELGTERALYIYKANKNTWEIWHKSQGAVLSSRHGGVLGDPFEDIRIERGAIVIDHFGGSRVKWNYTHRYRFQKNDWYLIGASIRYGAPCDFWDHFDYNLSTGKIDIKKEVENCDDESQKKETTYSFTHKLSPLPKMDGIYPGDTEVKSPEAEESFYY
ncbi:MAG: hypothetical protein AAF696_22015 [Bacteroidota bacterium]